MPRDPPDEKPDLEGLRIYTLPTSHVVRYCSIKFDKKYILPLFLPMRDGALPIPLARSSGNCLLLKPSAIMHLPKVLLALSIAGSTLASRAQHVRREDDDATPTEEDLKTAEAPKRFIVEFAEVRSACTIYAHILEQC